MQFVSYHCYIYIYILVITFILQEAVTCVKKLPPSNHAQFTASALKHVLERSQAARRITGHLFHDLVKTSVVTVDSYVQG